MWGIKSYRAYYIVSNSNTSEGTQRLGDEEEGEYYVLTRRMDPYPATEMNEIPSFSAI